MNDVLEVDPEYGKALPLDPFGSKPQWGSRIPGLGGLEPPPDPSYVFLTLDSRPAIGPVSAKIHFFGLTATRGTLLLEVRVCSAFPGSEHSRLKTVAVDLKELAAADGIVELRFESYRNAYYAIAGSINDETDALASHISITINRRATPVEHGRRWGWRAGDSITAKRRSDIESALIKRLMTDLDEPRLDEPVSQVGSPAQCTEQSFTDAMRALCRDPVATSENWSLAYVLQAIERFAGNQNRCTMLGYVGDESPLLSYFAAKEYEILGMRHTAQGDQQLDPGRELQQLWVPELCNETDFFAHAHFTARDIRLPADNYRDQFDIIWSIGANRVMTPQEFVYFAVNSLANAKLGGLAVHVFDYVEQADTNQNSSLSRHDIERLVALALAHRTDAARLKFRHGITSAPGKVFPFGLVLLRGGLPGA